jgi:serine/threonine protein kinase
MESTKFGRYEILAELGRGAMGAVHRARDPVIEREVAIKTLLSTLPPEVMAEVRGRFLREARSAGRLNHPNVVTIYDVGEENGVAYIAMELLEGRSLQDILRGGKRLAFAAIADIVAQVADGLDHAQQFGIVHRDVKPANIMVSSAGRAKLTDFGVAHVQDSSMTQTGAALGSPKYMSPEQVLGQPIDPRSDIFSLGIVLYEMLVGRTPFERPGDTTVFALMQRIAAEKHPQPSQVDPAIPAAFDAILERALAKTPAERYARAGEMARALRAAAAGSAGAGAPSLEDTDKTLVLPRAAETTPSQLSSGDRTMIAPPPKRPVPDDASRRLIADMESFAASFEHEEQERIRAEAEQRRRKQEEIERWAEEQKKRQEEFERQRAAANPDGQTTVRRSAALEMLKKAAAAGAGAAAGPDKAKQAALAAKVNERLAAAFRYLSEFAKELNAARPVSARPYGLLYLGDVANVTLCEGFTDSRLRDRAGKEVIDHVTFKFRLLAPAPGRLQVSGQELPKILERLDALRIRHAVQEQKNEFGVVQRAVVSTAGPFPCQAVLRGDYDQGCVAMDLINVRRQGPARLLFTVEEFTDDLLDEFGTYVLGADDAFEKYFKRK